MKQLEGFKEQYVNILNFDLSCKDKTIINQYVNTMTESIQQCQSLTHFTICFNQHEQIPEENLEEKQQTELILNLFNGEQNRLGLILFVIAIKDLIQLSYVQLDLRNILTDEEFSKELGNSIKNLINLNEFILYNNSNFSSNSLDNLISGLSYLKNLSILNFNFNGCRSINQKIITDLVNLFLNQEYFSHLFLDIGSCNLGEKEVKELSKGLSRLKNLEYLKFKCCEFGQNDILLLFQSLRDCQNLGVLDINFSQSTSIFGSLQCLGESLSQLNKLTDLSLIFPYNGDTESDCFEYLANGIEKCQKLSKLYLKLNGYDSFEILFQKIGNLTNLKEFNFDIIDSEINENDFMSVSKLQKVSGVQSYSLAQQVYFKKNCTQNIFALDIGEHFELFFESHKDDNQFKNIRELNLRINSYEEVKIECILEFINQFKNLKALKLCHEYEESGNGNVNQFDWINSAFSECKNLQYISINLTSLINDIENLNQITKRFRRYLIKKYKNLVHFDINI